MAGGASARMIPELASFRPEWLESSEVSFALDEPRVTGLSFFFHDEASCAEFAASESLDGCVMSDEKALRAKYSILPRYWLKIHYDGMSRRGLSQYFYINPTMHYPITTIRCFLRGYGLSDVGILEELLKPALEARETQWGLAIKRSLDQSVPRIFFSIERVLLKQVLAPFVRFGYLSEPAALLYLEWEHRVTAGEHVFISLDPTLRKLSSLDFCDLPSEQFPGVLSERFPDSFDYLKMRISDPSRPPEFTAYMPLRKVEWKSRS
jgi:hypothetical protein